MNKDNIKYAMLSFDTEEFDVPKEHGVPFSLEQGMEVSRYGTLRILDSLRECRVRATFFCTLNFVKYAPDIVEQIKNDGHEIASHGCDHWHPMKEDVRISKDEIEALTGLKIKGYRQPRMFPVDDIALKNSGYLYNASLNPAFIPGRYMHLNAPRTWFRKEGLMQIPASVTPWLRIPLFWLALHNFPLWLYRFLIKRTLNHDGYFNTYFHPWEFFPLGQHRHFRMPFIIRNHAGDAMCDRLKKVINGLKSDGVQFVTYYDFYSKHNI